MTQEKIRKNKEHMKDVVSLLNTRRLTTFLQWGRKDGNLTFLFILFEINGILYLIFA